MVPAVVSSIVVADALTRFAPLHSEYELKDTQMNRQLKLYEFYLDHNATKATNEC